MTVEFRVAKDPSTPNRPWFKARTVRVLHDYRLMRVHPSARWTYFALYALCAERGEWDCIRGTDTEIAWHVGLEVEAYKMAREALADSGLVSKVGEMLKILDWNEDQPRYTDADRQRKKRRGKPTLSSVSRDSHVTVTR